jgi:acyl-CoA synthetase (AMP-forming)/AMP-acid ligase II
MATKENEGGNEACQNPLGEGSGFYIRHQGIFMNMTQTAGQRLTWAAKQYGARPALVLGDTTLSFAEVEVRSNQLANALLDLGLMPGERFAVLLNNSMESVVSILAVEKAALTYVALNARHTVLEQTDILNDAQVSAVLLGPEFVDMAQALTSQVPTLRHVVALGATAPATLNYAALLASGKAEPPCVQIDPASHVARIAYTSGTTGKPKGVAYTAERLQHQLTNHFYAMEYGLSVDDAMLHVGPLTHAAGIYLLPCYLRGARSVIVEKFDPKRMLDEIQRHRITQLMLVPTMLSRLLDLLDSGVPADLSSLRRVSYGTAPTSVELIERALRHFGPILRQQYGMTEAVQPLAVLYPHDHVSDGSPAQRKRLSSCGKPTMNVSITIRNPADQEVPAGEIGEIAIDHRGIGAVEFWRKPELAAESIRNGRYYTGDLGYFDADGYMYIVGRNKEMIISGGFNVYAREVEDALASHPGIAEAAVLGIPDSEWGELIAAFVVARDGSQVTAQDLAAHCAERIAGYKKPRVVQFVKELPRNATGKVVKHVLRDSCLNVNQPHNTTT